MTEFSYRTMRRCNGYVWYCQTPGIHWAMDPIMGWELFLTDGPSWYLMGHGYEKRLDTPLFRDAMRLATRMIKTGEVVAR